jgi:DNA-binding NarL/FixJ family response regulator
MEPTLEKRLAIADGHDVYREGLKSLVGTLPWIEVTGEAFDDSGLFALVASVPVDVVIVDLALPGGEAENIVGRLRRTTEDLSIVALVTAGGETLALEAVRHGADALLVRDTAASTLIAAVACVASGRHFIDPGMAGHLLRRGTTRYGGLGSGLSMRQITIVELVARGLSNKQIARRVNRSEATVKSDLRTIYAELGVSSRAQAAATAVRTGLVD